MRTTRLDYYTNYKTNYDLINKSFFKSIFKIVKLTKIVLNIGQKDCKKEKILSVILALELLTNQQGSFTKSKKNIIELKIKKGAIVGCKVTLRKKSMFSFLEKLVLFYFPKIKDFKGFQINQGNFSFSVKNILNFFELSDEFSQFSQLPKLDVVLVLKNSNTKMTKVLLNSFNFPILKD